MTAGTAPRQSTQSVEDEAAEAMAIMREGSAFASREANPSVVEPAPAPSLRRVELPKRQPCFHCSRSLRRATGRMPAPYIGFIVTVDGFDRVLHRACVADFVAGVLPAEMEDDG